MLFRSVFLSKNAIRFFPSYRQTYHPTTSAAHVAWQRSGMLIDALVQIVQGSQASDVSSRDAVLAVLVLESKGAAGHANSSNNALASLRSAVSNPSVNQLYTEASSSWASWRLPCCCQSRARLVAARSSSDLACWFWAIAMAWAKQDSASA